jgi:putative PIN family toxin of toxin-antitoxin system
VRAVLDRNILVRAFTSPHGLARDLLLAILSSGHTLVLSNELLFEVAKVLPYPRLMMIHGQNEEAIYNFTNWLRDAAEIISVNPLTVAHSRDQNDIFILQTALNGDADVLCTGDQDFFELPTSAFLASVGIAVLTDVQLMLRLEA